MAGTDADGNDPTPREVHAAKDANADLEADNSTGKYKNDSASALHRFLDEIARSGGSNDAEVLREWIRPLVKEGIKEDFNMKDGDGQMLLHIAARRGLATAAESLIVDAKANVNTQNDEGSTPLIEACWGNHMALVEILLQNRADVKVFDNDGWSSLFLAARHGNNSMFQRLWKANKWDVNLTENFTGISLLQGAAYGGSREIVRCLRRAGARLDTRDDDGWTPLYAAVVKEREDAIEELLIGQKDENLQLETEDSDGRTPLLRAAQDGFWDGVRLLVKAGAKCNKFEVLKTTEMDQTSVPPLQENTALHSAVWQNNLQMVKFLLEHGADINARDPDGQQPMHLASLQGNEAILGVLLDDDNCSHVDTGDNDGMTLLHLASCPHQFGYIQSLPDSDSTSQVNEEMNSAEPSPVSKAGHYNEVVRHLLARNADTTLLTNDGKTAVELAFDHDHYNRGEAVLKVFSEIKGGTLETLMWAAGKAERHAIATSLIKKRFKESGNSFSEGSEGWNAIEWAAYAGEIRALWLLIASSPQGKETKRFLKSAKAVVEKSKDQGERSATTPDDQEIDPADDIKKPNKGTTPQEILDLINNPPTGLICRDSSTYNVPKDEDRFPSSKSYHATIVQFYKGKGKFDSIIRAPTIKETIYSQGPGEIMENVVKKLKEFATLHFSGLEESNMVQRPMFMDSKPKFTWIHLPATNMTWMDHLLQRIMRDENQPATHFNQAKSFFKDSWIEIPDKVSPSRIMRPRFVSRNTKDRRAQNDDGGKIPESQSYDKGQWDRQNSSDKVEGAEGKEPAEQAQKEDTGKTSDGERDGEQDEEDRKVEKEPDGTDEKVSAEQKRTESQNEEETAAPSLAATAIYMPYLSYSFQCDDGIDDDNEMANQARPSQAQKRKEKMPAKTEATTPSKLPSAVQQVNEEPKYVGIASQEKKLKHAKKLVKARKAYQRLLEEYRGKIVHGSSTLDESYYHFGEDEESFNDKTRRNKSQVVTESWLKGELGSYWLLVRVNQLWIWTINNKWLISASSHPIDDGEDELLNGILDRLEKQKEAAGSGSQPGSTVEMSQLIVDYCIETYERKPGALDEGRPEDCRLTGFPSIRQVFSKAINSIARGETKLSEEFNDVTKRLRGLYENTREHRKARENMDRELAKVTDKAKDLSSRVKDIMDELSILETVVEYQQDVQKGMKRNYAPSTNGKPKILETEYTATYVINDINRLYGVAERVHSAVNTTVSLHQSETANIQADLSVKQGRVLMVFTVVTILFLPMSFLTSLFALDVASFQQAPPWAFGVIVGASVGLFIPMVIFAFSWKRSEEFISDLLSPIVSPIITYVISPILSPIVRRVMALMCSMLELTESSNQTRDGERVSKTVPVPADSSFRGPSRRSKMSIGALQVSRRSNDDLEKGRSGDSDPTN